MNKGNFYKVLVLTLTCSLLGQCNSFNNFNKCEEKVAEWRNEAPKILKEFQDVEEEITQNKTALKIASLDEQDLFIRTDFPEKYEREKSIKLPKLKKWFSSKDWGFISYKGETKQIHYRTCNYRQVSYHGQLYFSKSRIRPSFTKNLVTEITDSLDLGNDWYYIQTKCDGCGN
ncbi:hypothetical protein AHMF7605_01360 [Adhaeribacter arboris]|uniref:Uncharacterized protein n=1 Tax=Adhaeribacter arboris TaxID=2072846 RepID=A0A2T2Y9S2_9BACT|nr:hypothetical protein [Adhaeribacter arboris]PSR52264.1 hypothetical protein AHMF7605_01360 [Adhaeribacter arboris]